MNQLTLENMSLEPSVRAELELMMAYKKKMLEEMERDPEVAKQFLKDIGLLDADGNRVVLPGEEPVGQEEGATSNGAGR